jgi:hypothetical protein
MRMSVQPAAVPVGEMMGFAPLAICALRRPAPALPFRRDGSADKEDQWPGSAPKRGTIRASVIGSRQWGKRRRVVRSSDMPVK